MQQHVERIYDLVFISLFNTILGALRAREWEEEERKQREGKRERLEENERRERERERVSPPHLFLQRKAAEPLLGENIKTEVHRCCLVHLLSVILLL